MMRKKQILLIAVIAVVILAAVLVIVSLPAGSEKTPVALENRIEQPDEITEPVTEPEGCPNIYNGTDDEFHIMNGWNDSNMGAHYVEQRDDGIYVTANKTEANMWYSLHTTLEGDFSQFRYLVFQVTAAEGTDYFITAESGDNKVLEYIFVGTGYKQQIAIDLTQAAKDGYGEMNFLQIFALPGKEGTAKYTLHDVWLSKTEPERFTGDPTMVSDWKDNWSGSYLVEKTENGQRISYNAPVMWSNISAVILYPDPEYCQLNMAVEVQGSQPVLASIKINYTDTLGNPISDDAIFSVETFNPGKNVLHLDMSKIFADPKLIPTSFQIFLDSTNEQSVNKKNTLLITETNLSKLTAEATAPKQNQAPSAGGGDSSSGLLVCGDFSTSSDSGYRLSLKDGALTVTMEDVKEWAGILYHKPVSTQNNLLSITMDNVDDSVTQMQILLMGEKTEAPVAVLTKDMLTGHGGPHTYTFYLADVFDKLSGDMDAGGTLKFQIESAPAAKDQYDGNGKLMISDITLSHVSPFANEGLGDWYVEWYRAEDISVANRGLYLEIYSANRKTAADNWSFITAVPTVNSGAGSTFTFEMEYCGGQTGDFLVQFYGENNTQADIYVTMEAGKAVYTLTVPETIQGSLSQVRIYPENPANAENLPEQAGTVRLYSAKLTEKPEILETLKPVLTSADQGVILKAMAQEGYAFYYKTSQSTDAANKPVLNDTDLTGWTEFRTDTAIAAENGATVYVQVIRVKDGKIKAWGETGAVSGGMAFSNEGLQPWYVPDWTDKIVMTDEGTDLAFTYDRSQVQWFYFAAPAEVSGVGAGGTFSFTLDFGEARGYSDNFMVRLMYADSTFSDLWPAAQEGKAEYTVTVPQDVTSTVTEVMIYPENPYNTCDSQTVTVKLYGASLKGKISNVGLGDWYVPDWTDKIVLTDEGADLAFTYDRSQVSWVYFAAPATAEGVGAGGTFSFTMDFGAERGYTDSFMVRLVYADDSFSDLWPALQEGRAEYTVTVPQDVTSTVKEVHIYPENPYESIASQVVTVRLYQAALDGSALVYEGLNPMYYPSWWGENGSWANDPINIGTENPAYIHLSYASRSASAAGWKCVVAEPSITASAGATLTLDVEFEPERTGEDFLVRFFSDNGEGDVYVSITGKRATYTVMVPDSVQGTVSEVRIHPENPWRTDLPNEASAMRIYSMVFAAPQTVPFENIGFGAWYVPSWAGGIQLTDQGEYLAVTYNRSNVGWQGVEAEVTVENITAGSQFVFTLDFGADRGYTDNFIIQFVDNGGNQYDSYKAYPAAQEGKAVYTVTVPDALTGTVAVVRILPENGWVTGLPSKEVTVKLYKTHIIA